MKLRGIGWLGEIGLGDVWLAADPAGRVEREAMPGVKTGVCRGGARPGRVRWIVKLPGRGERSGRQAVEPVVPGAAEGDEGSRRLGESYLRREERYCTSAVERNTLDKKD